MDNKTFLFTISESELADLMRAAVRQELKEKNHAEMMDKIVSPDKACQMFDPPISRQTLDNWEKAGLLNKYYIGDNTKRTRTGYKLSELMQNVKTLKKYSREKKEFTSEIPLP